MLVGSPTGRIFYCLYHFVRFCQLQWRELLLKGRIDLRCHVELGTMHCKEQQLVRCSRAELAADCLVLVPKALVNLQVEYSVSGGNANQQ